MIESVIADRFRVVELIAQRGPVTLYHGIDLTTGHPVVVKALRSRLVLNPNFVEHWRAQLGTVQEVGGEYLPTILDFGRLGDDTLYLVESPIPGVPLRQTLAAQNIPTPAEALPLVALIAQALNQAHRSGLAHGALTPGAITIQPPGADGEERAVVGDWEWGEIVASLGSTPRELPDDVAHALAPEQLGTAPLPATAATDVFALALLVYELLTNQQPFHTVAEENRVLARLTTPPTAPSRYNPAITPALEQLLVRALSRSPAERPPNAGAFLTAYRQSLIAPTTPRPTPTPVVTQTTTTTVRRLPQISPRLLAAVVGMALLALCLLAALTLSTFLRPTATQTTPVQGQLVPNLLNISQEDALRIAREQEFTILIERQQPSESTPANTILEQNPPPGSLPAADRVIRVTVSSPPSPVQLAIVPSVYALESDVAELVLARAGLRLGQVRQAHDLAVPLGAVIEQNPRADLQVPLNTPVDLIVSLGLPPNAFPTPTLPAGTVPGDGTIPPGGVIQPTPDPNLGFEPTPDPNSGFFPTPTVGGILPPLATPTLDFGFASPTPEFGGSSPFATATTSPFENPGEPTPFPDTPGVATPTTLAGPGGNPGALAFQDDFDSDLGNWLPATAGAGSGGIIDGVYELSVDEPGSIAWTQPDRLFSDFRVETTVSWPSPQELRQGAGLIFRLQDSDNFYAFEVDQFGNYRIRAREAGAWRDLQPWTGSDALAFGVAPNQLAIEVVGSTMTAEINGESVYEGSSFAVSAGDIGLIVDNEEGTTPTVAHFDDLTVENR